jgi:hypothetical protein
MTKPQKVNKQMAPPKYTTFYLVMLVLTSISVGFGVFNIAAIDTTINYLKTAPLFAILTFVQYGVTLLMVVALIYLYKKKELGLHLLISAYGLTTICMIIFPIATQPLLHEAVTQIVAERRGEITLEFATQVVHITFITIAVANAFSSILFAVLWYFAWKKQSKKDSAL